MQLGPAAEDVEEDEYGVRVVPKRSKVCILSLCLGSTSRVVNRDYDYRCFSLLKKSDHSGRLVYLRD